MAEFTGTAEAFFSASHIVPKHALCGRLHGHQWRVAVTIRAGQDPASGELVGLPELALDVERLAREVNREHVNDMFPASHPTPAGVALAFRERLALRWPNIVELTVSADNMSVTLHG